MAVGARQQAKMQTAVVGVGLIVVLSLWENQHPDIRSQGLPSSPAPPLQPGLPLQHWPIKAVTGPNASGTRANLSAAVSHQRGSDQQLARASEVLSPEVTHRSHKHSLHTDHVPGPVLDAGTES